MNKLFTLLLVLGVTFVPVFAQEQPTRPAQQPSAEEVEKEKAERQKNAYRLLDQIIDEAQSLRLPENRVRVQSIAADLLWDSNPGRARSLFTMAAENVAEMGRQQQNTTTTRRPGPQMAERRAFQLRQELVMMAARRDAQLAYQLLAITKPAALAAPSPNMDPRMARPQTNPEDNLEQMLLSRIASLDPKLAAQNADQMLDKGQFPRSMTEVLNQLYKQDPDAAAKIGDKTVKKLQSANLLTNNEATGLMMSLLQRGPRPAENAPAPPGGSAAVLEQGSYTELLSTVVDLALKATPLQAQQNQRGQGQRARPAGVSGFGPGSASEPTDAQREQNGALRLLGVLQLNLMQIDQYLPSKAAAVRQKLSETGMAANSVASMGQTMSALQGNPTSDALVQAALSAPPQMQSRIYQQAAFKALDEGNTDRARQIATDHLQPNARDNVMQQITVRELSAKAENARLEDIRQTIARLQSEEEKLNMLLQLARNTQQANPKLAAQLLDDARQMTNRRASGYDQFDQQLRVARAYSGVDPARSFEVLDPAISQLNELLSAAAVLNGFEVNMFRDGEMSLQSNNGLGSMVQRFAQELGMLADKDLERAETLAGRFQFAEPRIMSRVAIVQGLLGVFNTGNRSNIASGPVNGFRN